MAALVLTPAFYSQATENALLRSICDARTSIWLPWDENREGWEQTCSPLHCPRRASGVPCIPQSDIKNFSTAWEGRLVFPLSVIGRNAVLPLACDGAPTFLLMLTRLCRLRILAPLNSGNQARRP
jgi:hypothetical protein